MKEIYVLTSKVTGFEKQVYARNELDAIQQMQGDREGFRLGEFTIKVQERREMKSVYVPKVIKEVAH